MSLLSAVWPPKGPSCTPGREPPPASFRSPPERTWSRRNTIGSLSPCAGGANGDDAVRVELARELARQGHTVALLSHGPCHLAAWTHACRTLEREGVACHRHARPGEALAAAVQLDPQILHVHSSDLLPLAAQVAAETGAPVIFTAHGLGTLRQPLVKKADRVIAVGPRVHQELCAGGVQRLALVGNGVDTDRFRPGKKGRTLQ